MDPARSMLKFRLPYGAGTTSTEEGGGGGGGVSVHPPFIITPIAEYLNGDVYLPVWGRQTTTETRLVLVRVMWCGVSRSGPHVH